MHIHDRYMRACTHLRAPLLLLRVFLLGVLGAFRDDRESLSLLEEEAEEAEEAREPLRLSSSVIVMRVSSSLKERMMLWSL